MKLTFDDLATHALATICLGMAILIAAACPLPQQGRVDPFTIGAVFCLTGIGLGFARQGSAMNDVERPDDSGKFDDATLINIIAERFSRDADPVTQRDGAWLAMMARKGLKYRDTGAVRCLCPISGCVCLMAAGGDMCEPCANGSHIDSDNNHFEVSVDGKFTITACPVGCEDHRNEEELNGQGS